MQVYDHKRIEKKWQNVWEKSKVFQVGNLSKKPRFYGLIEFPYPSGAGMHVGHIRSNTAMDIISRKRRMEGYNVLYPIGWDAFGLPTENYAIKTGVHPIKVTKDNTDTFRRQLKSLGFSFDWSREINTTDPKYYKWTQWIFLQLFKKGLAYKEKSYINWCLSCKIGLANEEVVNGKCERCEGDTEKREKEQWMLAITKYADRLDKDLDTVDYQPQIKLGQRNWIGRSEGAEIEFGIRGNPSPALPEGEGEKFANIVILHGKHGTPENYFYPWLKRELEKKGHKVYLPALPNTEEPNDEEQATYVFKNVPLDGNTIIVTHSFGGVVAMRLLERGIKVRGLILFATPITGNFLDKKSRPTITDSLARGFNYEVIKKQADFFRVIFDSGDNIVPKKDAEILAKNLGTYSEYVKAVDPHFCADEEPGMLDLILENAYPSPALPEGEGEMPRFFTTNPELWRALQDKALEMRKNPTNGEKVMWDLLRRNTTEYHFRRQHIIDRFIVDFVCIEKRLVIEVDGDIHDYKKAEDIERTKVLNQLGFEIIRFSNNEVIKNKNNILEKIILRLNNFSSKALSFGEGWGGVLLEGLGEVKVFTTRPDTIFGATYMVLAPEHELVQKLKSQIKNWKEVEEYIKKAKNKTEIERTTEEKIKTGVELKDVKAINPATKEEIPVWIADYVLASYGTGAIMAVPAHDERDFEFAKKYNLEIKNVIEPKFSGKEGEEGSPKPGLPFEPREAVCAVVRNPKNNTYLCNSWKNFLMHGLFTGGREGKEDLVETARREVLEETGYKNLKFIKTSPIQINTFFYHRVKNVNRHAHFTFVFFDLEDEERVPVSEEENTIHEISWKKKDELGDFFTVFEGKFLAELLNNPSYVFTGDGIMVNSGKFDGLDSEQAKKEIVKFVGGKEKTTFKLRDWIFSRQRYWGEPIPVIFCENCKLRGLTSTERQDLSVNAGWIPVPEKDLPVELPKVKNYQPTDSGESPLANIAKWVNVKCPKCQGPAKRETDTMPNWAGSSWYFLRYVDPKNNKEFASRKKLEYWTSVDWYNGGMEHTTLHLLYSRFWHKFLFDLKLVPTSEPYQKRTSHGMILGEGGVKMSKSLGNVINPDDIVKTYGADTLRLYEMFMGPFGQSVVWSTESIIGSRRFLERVWNLGEKVVAQENLSRVGARLRVKRANFLVPQLLEKTIKKVTEDIEEMKFNTAISTLMIFVNEVGKLESISQPAYEKFLKILSPFAPHLAEELWQRLGHRKLISLEPWPICDLSKIQEAEIKIVVQINGKVRTEMMIQLDEAEEPVKQKALVNETILKHLAGREVKKVFYVKNRLINIVV